MIDRNTEQAIRQWTLAQPAVSVKRWINAGTQIVLVADPKNETLRIYRSKSEIQVLHAGESFSSGDVCGDWQLAVNDVFKIKS